MGRAKEHMMMRDDLAGAARGVLRQVGALKACEAHGDLYEGNGDVEGAYKLGNSLITRGEIELNGFTRAEFSELIKDQFEENSFAESCGYCAKNMRD